MKERETGIPDELLQPLATVLSQRFVQRWDKYPRQLDDGRYITVHKPLHDEHLLAHLRGDITLGTYVLDPNSEGHFLVLDADNEPDWRRIKAAASVVHAMGSHGYLERSRRGGHLWYFLDEKKTGEEIRTFGYGLLGYFSIDGIELFPKQDELKGGPGSVIRLPFGVHRLSGRRYGFYTAEGNILAPTLREQIEIIHQPETVTNMIFDRFFDYGTELQGIDKLESPEPWATPFREPEGETLSDRIKSAVPVRQFVLQYVELSKTGRGLCPFHDDHVESFSVNDEENYWHCFAGCGGGSIIDFWMKWQDCDFKTAVTELSENLLEKKGDL